MRGWIDLGSDVNWQDHGGTWGRKDAAGTWWIVKFQNYEDMLPHRFYCEVVTVYLPDYQPDAMRAALATIGAKDDADERTRVEAILAYNGGERVWEWTGDKHAARMRAKACRAALGKV